MSIFVNDNLGKLYKVRIPSIFKDYVIMRMQMDYVNSCFTQELCLYEINSHLKLTDELKITDIQELKHFKFIECNTCLNQFVQMLDEKSCYSCDIKYYNLKNNFISDDLYKFDSKKEYLKICDVLKLKAEQITYDKGIVVIVKSNNEFDDVFHKVISVEVFVNAFI